MPRRGNNPQSPVTPSSSPQTPNNTESGFGNIERMIASNFNNVQPGLRGDWTEIEGNWVLRPLEGSATSVVHFLGGAFVGAAPQLTYRLLLESLAARGIMVSRQTPKYQIHLIKYQMQLGIALTRVAQLALQCSKLL